MPRPVCVKCAREMENKRSGAVEFTAHAVGGPYQQWQGDLYRCSGCGAEVISGYGGRPTWEHFQGEASRDKDPIAVSHERTMLQKMEDARRG